MLSVGRSPSWTWPLALAFQLPRVPGTFSFTPPMGARPTLSADVLAMGVGAG